MSDSPPIFDDDENKDADASVILSLTEDINRLDYEKRRDKFVFALIVLMLFDFIVFQKVDDWSGAMVIGILQVLLVIFLGLFLEIPEVDDLINKILHAFSRRPIEEPVKNTVEQDNM